MQETTSLKVILAPISIHIQFSLLQRQLGKEIMPAPTLFIHCRRGAVLAQRLLKALITHYLPKVAVLIRWSWILKLC